MRWWPFKKKQPEKENPEEGNPKKSKRWWLFWKKQPWNSICLYPREKGGIKFEEVDRPPGRLWPYRGKMVHLLKWDEKETRLLGYEPPDKINMLPQALHRCLTGTAPMKRLLSYTKSWMDKASFAMGVTALGIMLFMLFLIYISTME